MVLAFDADAAGQGAAQRFYEWEERYQVRVSVASDLGKPAKDGWSWEIPAQGAKTARFVILHFVADGPSEQRRIIAGSADDLASAF